MGIAGEITENLRDARDSLADSTKENLEQAEKIAGDLKDDIRDQVREMPIVRDLEENTREFREGFQAGTEAMKEAVESAWEIATKLPIIGELAEGAVALALQKIDKWETVINFNLLAAKMNWETFISYINSLKIAVDIKAKGHARVQVSTSLFNYDIEFDICEGFTYQFELLDWTKLYMFYNFDNGLITFEVEIHDKVITKDWIKLKFAIPAVSIPTMMLKQCDDDDDDEENPEEETCVREPKKPGPKGNSAPTKGYWLRGHEETLTANNPSWSYYDRETKESVVLGRSYKKKISDTHEVRKTQSGSYEQQRTLTRKSSGTAWVYKNGELTNRATSDDPQWNYHKVFDWADVSDHHYRDKEWIEDYINNAYSGKTSDKEGSTTITRIFQSIIYVWDRNTETNGGNGPDKDKIPFLECNNKREGKKTPDVLPIMDQECCSLLRQVLDRLGGEDWEVQLPEELTNENDTPVTKTVKTIPNILLKQIEYQDELSGQYPIKIKIEDEELPPIPNQAELLVEMFGMLYELVKDVSLNQEIIIKGLVTGGLNRQELLKLSYISESIQDYLGCDTNNKTVNLDQLFDIEKQESIEEFLTPSKQDVTVEEFNEKSRNLSSVLAELLQAAAVIRGRFFRPLGKDKTKAVKWMLDNLKRGASIADEFDEEAADKDWDVWKKYIEDEYKLHSKSENRPDIDDIRGRIK